MPNRILKESICTSDSIDELNWFEEVLFYRLIVNCDDFGRFDGRVAVIKNRLFPLKDSVTLKSVESAINKLVRAGLVSCYKANEKPFLFLPTWNEHQSVRAKKSKYPEPEIICNQMQADVPVIQSNTKSNSISESESNSERVGAFDRFWEIYPKKVGKEAARRAFAKVKAPTDTLITAVEAQKHSPQWEKENGRFIPNPATWLNQGRWEDEVEVRQQQIQYADKGDLDALMEKMGVEYA